MIRIAICDDDVRDRSRLRELILKWKEKLLIQFDIIEFESGEAFLESGCRPELLFLDIAMKQKDGIQVGVELRKQRMNTIVIYVTNDSRRIEEAINEVHSYGYFIKPAKEDKLFHILDEALKLLNYNKQMNCETFLSEKKGMITIPVRDIYYFEYCARRVKLVTREENYIVKEKIGNVAERMEKYWFVMSHQSYVVNLCEVKEVKGQTLVMKNEESVCLAQKRASAVRKKIKELADELGKKDMSIR